MPFEKPTRSTSSANFFIVSEHVGTLLLFKVLGQKADHQTAQFGVKPTVWADVMLLDGPRRGTVFARSEIFHTKLYEGLSDHVGKTVLARLNKGDRAYWLDDPTPEDERYAEQFLSEGPTAPAPTPAGDPWDQQSSTAEPKGNPFAAADAPPF